MYEPPFTSTDTIDTLCLEIAEMVGGLRLDSPISESPRLHRELRIKTIHSSLVVEGNSLSVEQVTDILDGKRILGNPNDILEVKNADRAYALIPHLDPHSIDDLLRCHGTMMDGLVEGAGSFRSKNVGVFDGEALIHAGTPARYVSALMQDLFTWLRTTEKHPLLSSCIFHYEFEFIHPFSDGNGRTGRLWHTLLLSKWKKPLMWLPIESAILETQQDYYQAFGASEVQGDCAPFVEYMLEAIRSSIAPYVNTVSENPEKMLFAYVATNSHATIAQIAEHLGLSRRSVDRLVARLREEGRLERTGSKRLGTWIVR